MENASKALLMAAGILTGVLFLSLIVFLFSTYRETADNVYHQMRDEEVAQFNSFFVAYEGNEHLTYYDVWNIINKAREQSIKYEGHVIDVYYKSTNLDIYTHDFSIKKLKVVLGDADQTATSSSSSGNKNFGRIAGNEVDSEGNIVYKLKEFTCSEVNLDSASGMVNEIKFKDTL